MKHLFYFSINQEEIFQGEINEEEILTKKKLTEKKYFLKMEYNFNHCTTSVSLVQCLKINLTNL